MFLHKLIYGCAWSRAGREAALYVVKSICGLRHAKSVALSAQVGLGCCLASQFPNQIGKARVVLLPQRCTGRCQVCEPTHGFKPGVAVKKHKRVNFCFVTFGFEV